MATPRTTLSILLWSYLILSDTHMKFPLQCAKQLLRRKTPSVTAKTRPRIMKRPFRCEEQPLRMQNTIQPSRHGKVINYKVQKIAALICRESYWHSDNTWKFWLFKSKQDTTDSETQIHTNPNGKATTKTPKDMSAPAANTAPATKTPPDLQYKWM